MENITKHFIVNEQVHYPKQTVNTPGKLYIAGEYAVLEKEQPAIIVAIDAFLSCKVQRSTILNRGSITSSLFADKIFNYTRKDPCIPGINTENTFPNQFMYILSAIEVVEALLLELNYSIKDYHLTFSSDLISKNGDKYGFGSSGAVTVATIHALLQFYGLSPTAMTLYKLAAIASIKVSNKGSFGDLAASSFKGWILYHSPDRNWLEQSLKDETSVLTLLNTDWPFLKIKPLIIPPTIQLLIGWTQSPVSSDAMVQQYQVQRDTSSPIYHQFLKENQTIVYALAQALQNENWNDIHLQLSKARRLLISITKHWGIPIETPALTQLIEIAKSHQFEAKSSGAGGGDCGIAIGHANLSSQSLLDEWANHGITPLPRQIAY